MQNLLDVFSDYCKLWKLEVNLSKTKTVIFSKRKFRPPLRLKLDNTEGGQQTIQASTPIRYPPLLNDSNHY